MMEQFERNPWQVHRNQRPADEGPASEGSPSDELRAQGDELVRQGDRVIREHLSTNSAERVDAQQQMGGQ